MNSHELVRLNNVLYVPDFNQDIISVSCLFKQGYMMKGDKDMLQLCHRNRTLDIDTVDEQNMFYLECKQVPPNNNGTAYINTNTTH